MGLSTQLLIFDNLLFPPRVISLGGSLFRNFRFDYRPRLDPKEQHCLLLARERATFRITVELALKLWYLRGERVEAGQSLTIRSYGRESRDSWPLDRCIYLVVDFPPLPRHGANSWKLSWNVLRFQHTPHEILDLLPNSSLALTWLKDMISS